MKKKIGLFLALGLAAGALSFLPAAWANAADALTAAPAAVNVFGGPAALVQKQNVTMSPLEEVQARQEIRALADYYAVESDKNNNAYYSHIFTPNVHLRVFMGDKMTSEYHNVNDLIADYSKAQSATINSFHMIGQQVVEFETNTRAKGIVYATADMVNEVNGKNIRSSYSIRYYDTYEKINGRWWITDRDQCFILSSRSEMQ